MGGLAFDTSEPQVCFALKAAVSPFPSSSSTLSASTPVNAWFAMDVPHYEEICGYKAGKKKDPDTLSFDEAMRDFEHLQEWLMGMAKEIVQLEEKGCWDECTIEDAIAAGKKVIPSVWVCRVKRSPAGEITKRKGRICVQGDLMDDDSESFAPVCQFSSGRTARADGACEDLLIMCLFSLTSYCCGNVHVRCIRSNGNP